MITPTSISPFSFVKFITDVKKIIIETLYRKETNNEKTDRRFILLNNSELTASNLSP